MLFEPIYIPRALYTGMPVILRAYTGIMHVLATANIRKIGRGFGKNEGERTGRSEIRKTSLAVSVACMAIYGHVTETRSRIQSFPNSPAVCTITS